MRKDAWALRRCSPCRTHACAFSSFNSRQEDILVRRAQLSQSRSQSVHARVVVYMYLLFVMNWQNVSNDSDKGVQICIGLFIEHMNKSLVMHRCAARCSLATLTVALTDETLLFRLYVCNLVCSTEGKRKFRRQTYWLKAMQVPKWRKNVVYELLKITNRQNDHCMN